MSVVFAVVGWACVVAGVALWSVPAGLVVAGVGLVVAAYVKRYMEAQQHEPSRFPGS